LVSYYQYAEMTLRSRILGEVAKVFLSEPVFSELRTKQQLGYIVVARFIDLRGVVGLFVLIQSNVKSPHYLAT
jgi:insulysin